MVSRFVFTVEDLIRTECVGRGNPGYCGQVGRVPRVLGRVNHAQMAEVISEARKTSRRDIYVDENAGVVEFDAPSSLWMVHDVSKKGGSLQQIPRFWFYHVKSHVRVALACMFVVFSLRTRSDNTQSSMQPIPCLRSTASITWRRDQAARQPAEKKTS